MSTIQVTARWREELVAAGGPTSLVFEFIVGGKRVYFPTDARWREQVPQWARELRDEYLAACETWCAKEGMAISVVDDANVSSERPDPPAQRH